MSRHSSDFLIVGAGVIGSSIAYHLARQGQRVVMLERGELADSPVASWASAGQASRASDTAAAASRRAGRAARWGANRFMNGTPGEGWETGEAGGVPTGAPGSQLAKMWARGSAVDANLASSS